MTPADARIDAAVKHARELEAERPRPPKQEASLTATTYDSRDPERPGAKIG
jgi:hypothetical protein